MRDDRGSTLLLFPVAVLVVVLLGAIAVDSAASFTAQRELVDAAQAAANDGATTGADLDQVRAGAGYHLDSARVAATVHESFAIHGLGDAQVDVRVVDGAVVVSARREVRRVFGRAIPGVAGSMVVTARATARPRVR